MTTSTLLQAWPRQRSLSAARRAHLFDSGLLYQNGQAYSLDELKSWWQKNWRQTYTQLEQKQEAADSADVAYEQDFGWFEVGISWQRAR